MKVTVKRHNFLPFMSFLIVTAGLRILMTSNLTLNKSLSNYGDEYFPFPHMHTVWFLFINNWPSVKNNINAAVLHSRF